jgi:hypothetical protein
MLISFPEEVYAVRIMRLERGGMLEAGELSCGGGEDMDVGVPGTETISKSSKGDALLDSVFSFGFGITGEEEGSVVATVFRRNVEPPKPSGVVDG